MQTKSKAITRLLWVNLLLIFFIFPTRGLAQVPVPQNVFIVNSTEDSHDNHLGDDICKDPINQCSLRAAVEEANVNIGMDTIFLPAGIYRLTLGQIQITNPLQIIANDPTNTIVSAQNAFRVFLVDKPGSSNTIQVYLYGITVSDGKVAGSGGGIWSDEILSIENSSIEHNRVNVAGGGLINSNGSLNISNSSIADNVSVRSGGGIYNVNGPLTVINTRVFSNSVTSADYQSGGGGINNYQGEVKLTHSDVISNTVDSTTANLYGGGGILNYNGKMSLSASKVQDNLATTKNAAAKGGGIYSIDGDLSLTNSLVKGNNALGSGFMVDGIGGGITTFLGTAKMDHSTISDNHASTGGGGIVNESGKWNITFSKIEANSSVVAGGVHNSGTFSSITIDNSSISNNNVTYAYAAFFQFYNSITITSSILSNNLANGVDSGSIVYEGSNLKIFNSTVNRSSILAFGGVDISHSTISDTLITSSQGSVHLKNTILAAGCSGSLTSHGYNMFVSGTGCSYTPATGDITGDDPGLAPLGDNGGFTATHALLPGSGAIDMGTCTDILGNWVPGDQRGAHRIGACDIGAFEYGAVYIPYFIPVIAR